MNNNKVYILEDRGVIYISGEDFKFLQNLISNDVNKINENISTFEHYYLLKENIYLNFCC